MVEEIDVNGFRIAFKRKGQGAPLVLLHGAFGDNRIWRRQLDGLSRDFTVVAWDAPGCGGSSDPPENFKLSDYADYLAALIDVLELEQPHILGLSFGGGLALEFYHRYPHIPATLILAGAYAGWAGSLPPEEVQKRLKEAKIKLSQPKYEVIQTYMPTFFSESVSPDLLEETAAIMADYRHAGMLTMLSAFAEADLREVLPGIKVPTLLLYGEVDQRSPLTIAREMHENIPGSALVILPGVGHVSNMEAPEAFNNEVLKFIKPRQT